MKESPKRKTMKPQSETGGKPSLGSSGLASEVLASLGETPDVPEAREPLAGAQGSPPSSMARTGEDGSRRLLDFIDELEAHRRTPEDERVRERTIQLVTFHLDHDEYGVEIERVREVLRITDVVAFPQAPEHVRGVTNVRGTILPVLEVKTRMGMGPVEIGSTSRIVVVEGHGRIAGILVDRIGRVLRVNESSVEPPPAGTVSSSGDYVVGVAKTEERIVILIDLDRVLLVR